MEVVEQILSFIQNNLTLTFIGAFTIIQISPIKIDPWTWIVNLLKKWLLGDIVHQIAELKTEIDDERARTKRWNILNFANSCRQGTSHTKEEWEHCLDELYLYEKHCEEHNIPNGVMVECSRYLKTTFRELLNDESFH